jgi:hypothetical protein
MFRRNVCGIEQQGCCGVTISEEFDGVKKREEAVS